ncbi:hypothetical protein [Actinoplanes utahensis]|uniref:hypothetical protein n=1 Tax=Actinoplanes utahensis TaxID=1869 RepID=UPI001269D9B2|nr:hypothetical protein [Actinoplanes utahensis]
MAVGQVVRKALPGLPVWAVLFLLAVPVAILANAMIIEVPPRGDDTFGWTRMTMPLAGAVAAARWTARTGRRRTLAGFASAVLAATLTGALYLALSLLTYRWAVPLPDPAGVDEFLVLPAAVVGGAAGYGAGLYVRDRPLGGLPYVAGAVLAACGGLVILPATDVAVLHGRPNHGGYVPGDAVVRAPSAGRYGIIRRDSVKETPDCRITGPGRTGEPAVPLTVPVDGSHDGTSEVWVAVFAVPSAGSYRVTCDITEYGTQPLARGVSPRIRTWPAPLIVLLGALPGLAVIVDTVRRRGGGLRRSRIRW